MAGRKPVIYQAEILQALNLINQNTRAIPSNELVEVRCGTCKDVHSILKFCQILRKFKERWYGWECKKCSTKRRSRSMHNFWVKKELKDQDFSNPKIFEHQPSLVLQDLP